MKTFLIRMLSISVMTLSICGCHTKGIDENTIMANPNNVYRFTENTVMKVMVQDEKTGQWKVYDKKVLIPIGYYIGSGLE